MNGNSRKMGEAVLFAVVLVTAAINPQFVGALALVAIAMTLIEMKKPPQ